jgi:hypothetical protein
LNNKKPQAAKTVSGQLFAKGPRNAKKNDPRKKDCGSLKIVSGEHKAPFYGGQPLAGELLSLDYHSPVSPPTLAETLLVVCGGFQKFGHRMTSFFGMWKRVALPKQY